MSIITGGSVIEGAGDNVISKKIGYSSPGDASVHAAVTDTGTSQTVSTGILPINEPGRITATIAGTTSDVAAVQSTISGTDPNDLVISEALPAFTVNTTGTVTGVKVFKSVTSIAQAKHDGTGVSVSYGVDGAPAVADTDGIMSALTDTGTSQTVSAGTSINALDVPRNITATVAATTTGHIAAVQVGLAGVNEEGVNITETLTAFTVNTAGTVTGTKAFKEVTQIDIPKHNGTSVTTSIGFGNVLGIGERLERNTVNNTYLNNIVEGTSPTVAVNASTLESNTIDLSNALNSTPVRVEYVQTPQT